MAWINGDTRRRFGQYHDFLKVRREDRYQELEVCPEKEIDGDEFLMRFKRRFGNISVNPINAEKRKVRKRFKELVRKYGDKETAYNMFYAEG